MKVYEMLRQRIGPIANRVTVDFQGESIQIRGYVHTYYEKQLIQETIMRMFPNLRLYNEVLVHA